MKYFKLISFYILITFLSSCKFTRPLTSVIRNSKVMVKDNNPGKIIITKEYNYITLKQFAILGSYKNTRIIDVDNGYTIELTRTRKIAGFSADKPSYVSIKQIFYNSKGEKQLSTKKIYKWGVDVVLDKSKYYEKGKKIKKEDCLKD